MKSRWRWGWLVVPVALVAAMFAVPAKVDYAEIAREGTPISMDAFMALRQNPPFLKSGAIGLSLGGRVRAWRLPETLDTLATRLQGQGLSRGIDSWVWRTEKGVRTRSIHERRFDFDANGSRVILVEGTQLPKGAWCAMRVEERTGFSALWGGFVARFGRVGGP